MDNGHILALTGAELDAALARAQNALPRDGSAAMTGPLVVEGDYKRITFRDSSSRTAFFEKAANVTENFGMYNSSDSGHSALLLFPETAGEKDMLALSTRNGTEYTTRSILHTGNKPSGSYTGNGSTEARPIDVGGVGNVIVLFSGYGVVFVTGGVAHIIRNDGSVLQLTNVSYGAGVLNLSTDDPAINLNSVEYHYQVL